MKKQISLLILIIFLAFGCAGIKKPSVFDLSEKAGADMKVSALPAPAGGPIRTDKLYIVDDPAVLPISTSDTIANVFGLLEAADIPDLSATYPLITSINTPAKLETVAGLGAYASDFLAATDEANFKVITNLEAGVDYNAYSVVLTTWAGITPGANMGTFLATPSLANLMTALTDEGVFAATLLGYADAASVLAGIGAQGTDTDLTSLAGGVTGIVLGAGDGLGYAAASAGTEYLAPLPAPTTRDGDTTPLVVHGGFYLLTNAGALTVTDFHDAANGHAAFDALVAAGVTPEIWIGLADADITIDFSANANIEGNGGQDFTASASQIVKLHFIYENSLWNCTNLNTAMKSPTEIAVESIGTGIYKKVEVNAGDGTYDGNVITRTITAGTTNAYGQAYHVHTDGTLVESDADVASAASMPVFCLGLAAATGAQLCLTYGTITETDWDWAVGGLIYAGDNPATTTGLTQTAPATTGDQVQVLGVALTADTIFFNPSLVLVEVP